MAEAGSFADKVKQQADIVRVVGEYVRLKKTGKDFSGLCPFHQEKTPSFTVSPIKQIFYCFGCGKGGDVYNFVMDMEKCEFPEAVKVVAEKCGIAIPRQKERSPEERKENQQRSVLVEMHREAQTFLLKQLEGTLEGKAARAYLEDRGLDKDAIAGFGIGYAPSGGDALLRHLKPKYNDKLLVDSDDAAAHRRRSARNQFQNPRWRPYLARDLRDTPEPLCLPAFLRAASGEMSAPRGAFPREPNAVDSLFVPLASAPSAAEWRSRISPRPPSRPRALRTSPCPSRSCKRRHLCRTRSNRKFA